MAFAVFSWLPIVILLSLGLIPAGIWPGLLWLALFGILFLDGRRFVPARLKKGWFSFAALFGDRAALSTHSTARFSAAEDATAAGHLAPSAPAYAFVLGWLRGTGHLADGRFRQGGHILTCAPTGAGNGIGAVIPNPLDYPGSAFVLDFKGENYAVTARARREAGQDLGQHPHVGNSSLAEEAKHGFGRGRAPVNTAEHRDRAARQWSRWRARYALHAAFSAAVTGRIRTAREAPERRALPQFDWCRPGCRRLHRRGPATGRRVPEPWQFRPPQRLGPAPRDRFQRQRHARRDGRS